MSEYNYKNNLGVWFDIPVVDLDRAVGFYKAVLNIKIDIHDYDGFKFGVFDHDKGNAGCLVPNEKEIASDKGIMLYLNVNGRIHDAVEQTKKLGGKIIEEIKSLGEYGFRSVILDSEGNRIVLHSHESN